MTTHFNTFIITISAFLLFCGCSTESEPFGQNRVNQNETLRTRSDLEATEAKARLISKEMIPTILKGYLDNKLFEKVDEYSLKTISKEGRDLIYVVNLTDGGWVLVSGIMTENENPILGYSTEGEYEPESIQSPEAAFWLEMTESMVERRIDEFEEQRSRLRSFGDDYFWVLIPINSQTTTVPHSSVSQLLSTKWGQGFPWNYKCPTIDSTYFPMSGSIQCFTGCVATAYAQVLYYLHNSIGKPNMLYHQINTAYEWHTSYFSPVHELNGLVNNSSRWNSMPLVNPGYRTAGTDYVGDLMIEIGYYVFMRYFPDISEANLSASQFNPYGISCTHYDYFDSSVAISQLNNDIPIIVGAYNAPSGGSGHCWVIDGHVTTLTTIDQRYQWRRLPIEVINNYNNYVCYSDFEMQLLFPNVVDYQIEHNYSYSYSSTFHMNFGWEGNSDGFNTMPYSGYPYRTEMITNFQ